MRDFLNISNFYLGLNLCSNILKVVFQKAAKKRTPEFLLFNQSKWL